MKGQVSLEAMIALLSVAFFSAVLIGGAQNIGNAAVVSSQATTEKIENSACAMVADSAFSNQGEALTGEKCTGPGTVGKKSEIVFTDGKSRLVVRGEKHYG